MVGLCFYWLVFAAVQPVFAVRLTSTNDTGKVITFQNGVFDATSCEYICGNSTSGQEACGLVMAEKAGSEITLNGISPETIDINEIETANHATPGHVENTLYGKKITHMALMGSDVAVCADADPTHVFLVQNIETGVAALKNATESEGSLQDTIPLQDINSSAPAQISSLTASSWRLFLALAVNGVSFGDQYSCIRALGINDAADALEIKSVTKSISNNAGGAGVQDECGDVAISGLGGLCWDSNINRLFVGLDHAISSTCKMSLLVGRLEGSDSSEIVLEGVVPYNVLDVMETSTCSKIIGSGNITCAWPCTMSHVRTMSTTTGGLYLVSQVDKGPIDDPHRSRKIFALPLVATNSDQSKVGTFSVNRTAHGAVTETQYIIFETSIADVDSQDDPLSFLWSGNDENIEEAAALVGGSVVPVAESDQITDIRILDDTVIVSCIDDNVDGEGSDTKLWRNQMGMFASTALFDQNGVIEGWTAWRQLYEVYDHVHHFALDRTNDAFWMVHGASADSVTYKEWGDFCVGVLCGMMPESEDFLAGPNLSVYSVKMYPYRTTGIGNHRWVVATGYKRLMLLRTCGGYPQYTENNYMFFDTTNTSSFNQLGPIYCTEISHSDQEDEGWLFAGGYGGLAVLSAPSGNGWDGSVGLSSVSELEETVGEETSAFTFKTLSGIEGPIYKLHADGKYLYAMTRDVVYKIEMNADKFRLTDPAELDEAIIYSGIVNEYLFDMAGFNERGKGFLATTERLCWHNDWTEEDLSRAGWSTVSTFTSIPLSISFKSMNVTGTFAGQPVTEAGTIGNLYISSNDTSNACSNIHRYHVKGTFEGGSQVVTAIEPINYGDVTTGIFTITPHTAGPELFCPLLRSLWPYFDENDLLATTRLGLIPEIFDDKV